MIDQNKIDATLEEAQLYEQNHGLAQPEVLTATLVKYLNELLEEHRLTEKEALHIIFLTMLTQGSLFDAGLKKGLQIAQNPDILE